MLFVSRYIAAGLIAAYVFGIYSGRHGVFPVTEFGLYSQAIFPLKSFLVATFLMNAKGWYSMKKNGLFPARGKPNGQLFF